jgi:serine/threonine protein kinase
MYGITKNPANNKYMMVMRYVKYNSLRRVISNNFKELTWNRKINILNNILDGLNNIHKMDLMHKDFHSGNIVNETLAVSYITDFGLCKPVTENNPENIYGVIPFMAPETLSNGTYTKASDIYSFGMIMLEVLTSYPPYYNISHDENLTISICKGQKPEIKCIIPDLLKNIMEKCWDTEPQNRPTAEELHIQFKNFIYDPNDIKTKELKKQLKKTDKLNKNFIPYDISKMHHKAIYTSRLITTLTTLSKIQGK